MIIVIIDTLGRLGLLGLSDLLLGSRDEIHHRGELLEFLGRLAARSLRPPQPTTHMQQVEDASLCVAQAPFQRMRAQPCAELLVHARGMRDQACREAKQNSHVVLPFSHALPEVRLVELPKGPG